MLKKSTIISGIILIMVASGVHAQSAIKNTATGSNQAPATPVNVNKPSASHRQVPSGSVALMKNKEVKRAAGMYKVKSNSVSNSSQQRIDKNNASEDLRKNEVSQQKSQNALQSGNGLKYHRLNGLGKKDGNILIQKKSLADSRIHHK